ncbi:MULTISPECIES: tRNA (adenosine(37)-N6)-threonylcarbamoyltransferase complex ATPase subunit type 1 TsaE [unclassified Luteococcus]|uniref:tRNA (adenosine(37)-N6)-threonylcarbamoyltransferase complex ATPase subunit type 1 TsaE n=2 Tax=unclassified Luteococcus TaxID=2639923 RepID=UPI00313F218E
MTDSEQVDLRLAEADDAPAMLEVIHQAFGARPAVDPPAAALSDTVDDVLTRLAAAPGVIAEVDGRMVGCLHTSLDGEVGGLHRVSVLPGQRTHGVASTMVRGAGEVLLELGAKRLELLCRKEFPQTCQWWQSHGFRVLRETPLGQILGIDLPARVEAATGEQMQELGRRLAGLLRAGDVVVASGDLGAGKTTLTQGIGAGLDVDGPVISPTFVLSRVHHNRGAGPDLVHVDAYRLGSEAELFDLDLDLTLPDAVTLVEWGAGLAEGLSDSVLQIDIRRSLDPDDETRVVYFFGTGERWQGVDLHQLEKE